MTRCDVCWAGLGLWAYLYNDAEHGEALHDMTLSLAALGVHSVCSPMVPWAKDPADVIEHIHGIGHRMVERYARLLLERAELACRQAREADDQARARGIQTNIDLLQLARE
jgi:hypothetical protein